MQMLQPNQLPASAAQAVEQRENLSQSARLTNEQPPLFPSKLCCRVKFRLVAAGPSFQVPHLVVLGRQH